MLCEMKALQHRRISLLILGRCLFNGLADDVTVTSDMGKFIYRWADSHSVDRLKVQVKKFQHGGHMLRGIGAAKDIEKDETILSVPEHLMVLSSAMPAQEACHRLWEVTEDAHSRQILNLVYEKHRGRASKWYDVIQDLPTLEDFQKFYPYALIDYLSEDFQRIPIINTHRAWREANDALRLDASFFTPSCFTMLPPEDDFLWAECVVSSRQFNLGEENGKEVKAMVPFIDYANAAFESGIEQNTDWNYRPGKSVGGGNFVLTATKSIKAGEEILEQYKAEDTGADYILDTWGFLPEPGHPSRKALDQLSDEECIELLPIIHKYTKDGHCAHEVQMICNLVTLAELHCQHLEHSEF